MLIKRSQPHPRVQQTATGGKKIATTYAQKSPHISVKNSNSGKI